MKKMVAAVLLGCLLLAGCGTTIRDEIAKQEQKEADGDRSEAVTETEAVEETESESETEAEEKEEKEFLTAKRRSRYADVLAQLIGTGTWPDGSVVDYETDASFGEMEDNQFAIADVDGDGEEELMISYSTTVMAGMHEDVYGYDAQEDEVYLELSEFPGVCYYENGWAEASASHNHSMGPDFWPYQLYAFDKTTRTYETFGSVEAWDKSYYPENYDGEAFPDDQDEDGDGILYFFQQGGNYFYEKGMDEADYKAWRKETLGGAKEIPVKWKNLSYENYENYAADYVQLLCERQMENGLVYGRDFGLLMMQGGMGVADLEMLLEEKYGVEVNPADEYGEQKIGLVDGAEVFTFDYLDAGFLEYKNVQVKDFTILGIYPGMEQKSAAEAATAFGMQELEGSDGENYGYATGKGFGNYAVYFSVEDGKVTSVTIGPYTAYAG